MATESKALSKFFVSKNPKTKNKKQTTNNKLQRRLIVNTVSETQKQRHSPSAA